MDARIAAELLYESEATLRMVDSVLDELHLSDAGQAEIGQRPMLSLVTDADSAGDDRGARGYWQVQDLLESVQDARRLIAPGSGQHEIPFSAASEPANLDSLYALIDSLESLDERSPAQATLFAELRDKLGNALTTGLAATGQQQRAASAVEILAEVEARLTRLGHFFEDVDG